MVKYARAKTIENAAGILREFTKKAALAAVLGGTGGAVARKVWDEFH